MKEITDTEYFVERQCPTLCAQYFSQNREELLTMRLADNTKHHVSLENTTKGYSYNRVIVIYLFTCFKWIKFCHLKIHYSFCLKITIYISF